jgi:hypothetical protein
MSLVRGFGGTGLVVGIPLLACQDADSGAACGWGSCDVLHTEGAYSYWLSASNAVTLTM